MWLETKKARNFNAVVWVLGEVNGYGKTLVFTLAAVSSFMIGIIIDSINKNVHDNYIKLMKAAISSADFYFSVAAIIILNRVQFETCRFQFRSSPPGRPWKVGTTGFKLDAV